MTFPDDTLVRFAEVGVREIGPALVRQEAMVELVGEMDWKADLEEGTLSFSSGLTVDAQILGTEDPVEGTFMWAWANEWAGAAAIVTEASTRVRAAGLATGVTLFSRPFLSLPKSGSAALVLVASGVAGGMALYRGPHSGGYVYFLLPATVLPAVTPTAMPRLAFAAGTLALQQGWDSRDAVRSVAEAFHYTVHVADTGLVGVGRDGEFQIDFDKHNRIARISGQFQPKK